MNTLKQNLPSNHKARQTDHQRQARTKHNRLTIIPKRLKYLTLQNNQFHHSKDNTLNSEENILKKELVENKMPQSNNIKKQK